MTVDRFYLVWCDSLHRPTPRVKHATAREAYEECLRLADKQPGDRFYVLEPISGAQGVVEVNPIDIADPDRPKTPA